jgi:hypothetical protein
MASAAICMGVLFGCIPGTHRPPIHPTFRISPILQQSPLPTRTRTATAAATALPASTDLPTSTPTNTGSPTWTPTLTNSDIPTSTPTITSWLNSWPTPTRGLPPKATRGPKQTCPPPTKAAVEIQFAEDPEDYGPQILEYIRARGNASGLSAILNQFKVSLPYGDQSDLAASYAVDVTGNTTNEIIITLVQTRSGGETMYGWPISTMMVFVVGCVDRQFQMLYQNESADIVSDPNNPSGVLRIDDLNANGLKEIVFASLIIGKFETFWEAEILEWDGTEFRTLFRDDRFSENRPPVATNAKPEFRDVEVWQFHLHVGWAILPVYVV